MRCDDDDDGEDEYEDDKKRKGTEIYLYPLFWEDGDNSKIKTAR